MCVKESILLNRLFFYLVDYDLSKIEVDPLTDFMDRVNNQEFDAGDYFISYVHSINKLG